MRSDILAPGQNQLLLERAREFAQAVGDLAKAADDLCKLDEQIWPALRNSGLAMAPFGEAFGGAGLGEADKVVVLCKILRIFGAADLSVARLFEGHLNAILLVSRLATADQIGQLAKDVGAGALSAVWGADDANGLQRNSGGNGWILNGNKILASGAGFVQRPLVTVSTSEGPVLYLLKLNPDERADVDGWRPLGMRATATGTVNLTGLPVGEAEQIGRPGDFLSQPFFSGGAWRFCAAHLGAMERLSALYAEQLRARNRGDDPFQLERLAQCAAACGTALFWIEEAARRLADESLSPDAVVGFANLTRMVTERAALDVIERVQRGIGLAAFMRGNPIERISRDLATYLRQPVPDLAMRDAARAVLSGALKIGDWL
jgi:alkylation response protein AidB-like acyl-CoA dehydrogenase